MVDKLGINNELIKLKPKTLQAKNHIMNKLVQKLKEFRKELEKNPENEKVFKKSKIIEEEISIVKKFHPIETSKKALINSKNPIHMITNEKATAEERALARIFSHKNLVTGIAAIKEKFELDDSNDIWKRMIFEVGKKKKMKLKKAGKWVEPAGREKKTVQKMSNKPQIEREEWLKNNTDAKKECKEKSEKVEGKKPKRKATVKDDEQSSSDDENSSVLIKANEDSSEEESDTSDEEQIIKKPVTKKVKMEEMKEDVPNQTIDSFFITESGSNYMSSVVLDRSENDEDINTNLPFHKKLVNKNQIHTPGINRRQRRQGITVPTFAPKPIEPAKKLNEDVHPSWLAKQKQRSIQEFKGKKITFDDSGSNTHKFVAPKIAAESVPDKTLHPSWAAKLKQKPIMTEFKGSKIVFDD